MNIGVVIFVVIWLLVVVGVIVFLVRYRRTDMSRQRLFKLEPKPGDAPVVIVPTGEPTGLARWLFLAGYRSRDAARNFILASAGMLLVGAMFVFVLQSMGIVDTAMKNIGAQQGGQLDILALPIMAIPWVMLLLCAAMPYSTVARKRKARVQSIDQDLPLTLEILATLVETGLSFDPALARLLESQPAERPLTIELKNFREETRAGRARVDAFRRLARRCEVTSLSTFVSAIVQAEQAGGGIATVLVEQSQDLRKRRRERALEAATALPVKQLIPLFICFLPGIFVWSLGPTMYKLVQFFDTFAPKG